MQPELNSKYPICEAGQQFIFACRRTAARLELSDAEVLASYALNKVVASRVESRTEPNVVGLSVLREVDEGEIA